MSDNIATPARPVSLFTIVFLFAIFAAFLLVIRYFYHPETAAAFVAPVENLPKEMEWRSSRESRQHALQEVRDEEAKKATAYAWIDKNAGVVQLPIERAIELTARD